MSILDEALTSLSESKKKTERAKAKSKKSELKAKISSLTTKLKGAVGSKRSAIKKQITAAEKELKLLTESFPNLKIVRLTEDEFGDYQETKPNSSAAPTVDKQFDQIRAQQNKKVQAQSAKPSVHSGVVETVIQRLHSMQLEMRKHLQWEKSRNANSSQTEFLYYENQIAEVEKLIKDLTKIYQDLLSTEHTT